MSKSMLLNHVDLHLTTCAKKECSHSLCHVPTLQASQTHRLIVTVMLLLCTIKHGGQPRPRTSKSLTYAMQASSSVCVPCAGLGSVVNITAVSLLFCLISSFSIRCCARHGKSLNDNGRACVEYVDPRDLGGDGEGFLDERPPLLS